MAHANLRVDMVGRNQDVEEVVRNVRQDNLREQNNLAHLVKNMLSHNGLNVGLHRPNFVSPLAEYILQIELPNGWKIPKFAKFVGDTSELIVEHIARYQAEGGDIANYENLKIRFCPNSLTINAFT